MRVSNSICVLYKVKYQITFVRQSNRTFESRNTILHANFICCYMRLSVGYNKEQSRRFRFRFCWNFGDLPDNWKWPTRFFC